MINFTVGPVQSSQKVREIGAENTPYFRTPEFSEVMFENEEIVKRLSGAPEDAKVVFITGSSTASMEAVVMNTLDRNDKALVVNGGGFGERFVQLCEIHDIPHDAIKLSPGTSLKKADLDQYEDSGYTAFLVNLHETSTGVLYDIDLISDFCKRNNLFLIVDAVSTFLADPFNMKASSVNVMLTGSQKALAVPPGVSLIVLDRDAQERVSRIDPRCMYLNLKSALKDAERGQTPFTPAVTTLLQINQRLKEIEAAGGTEAEVRRISKLASHFRENIGEFPFEFFAEDKSNAVTSLKVKSGLAKEIFNTLKDEYEIWVCPNGGDLADTVFRVGHLGDLTEEDNNTLIEAMRDLQRRGII